MLRVLILGYYNRRNFGDDLFAYVFKNVIFRSNYEITILNLDDIPNLLLELDNETIKPFDRVVVGGGDLVNEYYFSAENVKLFRQYFHQVPIFFVGVGLSYPDLIPLLDFGDYFYIRNKADAAAFKRRFGAANSFYIPDLAYALCNEASLNGYKNTKSTVSKVGFCLPYTWIANSDDSMPFLSQLVVVIREVALHHQVYLLPFDTSDNNKNSDILLLNALRPLLRDAEFDESGRQCIFYNEERNPSPQKMIQYMKELDVVFASRFHSVVMSILVETPFISLYSTRKIQNMQKELSPDLSSLFVPLKTDRRLVPTGFDVDAVLSLFDHVRQNYTDIAASIRNNKKYLCGTLFKVLKDFEVTFQECGKRTAPPQYISDDDKQKMKGRVVDNVLKCMRIHTLRNVDKLRRNVPMRALLPRHQHAHSTQKRIAEEVLHTITGDPYAPYYYGLVENVLQKPLVPQVEWLIEDYYRRYKFQQPCCGRLRIVNKNFQELHRSGWQYSVNSIVTELNMLPDVREPLLIDTYVDKTFHWNEDFYVQHGVVPYKTPWIGFLHHTYSSYTNNYNCHGLFQDHLFIESLANCKCLIVMSKYLKRQVQQSLEAADLGHVRVEAIYHPSEFPRNNFTWDKFVQNQMRTVVQVGNWLRNVFAIYQLEVPSTSIVTRKSILRNKNSDNYLPPPEFVGGLLSRLLPASGVRAPTNIVDICKISFENMHMKGLYEHVIEMENSVSVIEHLDNDKYDTLLSENIVFIQLVDASAVNTVIECIIRDTPILVNPIEPVIEILGSEYPCFYNTMYEASKLLENADAIRQAHEYLKTIDKTKFMVSTFVNGVKQLINQVA